MIERKIIIGLITSTEYCEKIKSTWNPQLLESGSAKMIANWVWEYYTKYKKAPGKEIETIYYTKVKEGKLQKVLAEEIEEDILPGLSAEYEKTDFNLQYLLEETDKYFSERHLNILTNNVQALVAEGKTVDAVEMVTQFKQTIKITEGLDDFIKTVDQIRGKKVPHPITLMKPWLKEGQMTIIYGSYGSGKSLFTIAVAYLLGIKECDESVGEGWFVKNPVGTLYIDGELGEQEMEDRIKKFEWLGKQKYKIQVLSLPEYQLETEDTFYLSSRVNQQKIIKWLQEHSRYKLVALDSASTLFGLENENDNSEWNNKVNPFLRDLRALGVACLLLHHAGKDNKKGLRGASAMGAMAHNILRLTNHGDKDPDAGEAWFRISKDKQRAGGFGFKDFSLHFYQNETETETHWEVT